MRRYLVGLLAAYAALMTIQACKWSTEAWFLRGCFDRLMQGKHGRPIHYDSLAAIDRDFGIVRTIPGDLWARSWLWLADHDRAMWSAVAFLFAAGLIVPRSFGRRAG